MCSLISLSKQSGFMYSVTKNAKKVPFYSAINLACLDFFPVWLYCLNKVGGQDLQIFNLTGINSFIRKS